MGVSNPIGAKPHTQQSTTDANPSRFIPLSSLSLCLSNPTTTGRNHMKRTIYILRYRWLDLPEGEATEGVEYYDTEAEATAERNRLVNDERLRADAFDPKAIGQFQISIERYVFDGVVDTVIA